MDLSKQLKGNKFNLNKTYNYSFRKRGNEPIELNAIEYNICKYAIHSISEDRLLAIMQKKNISKCETEFYIRKLKNDKILENKDSKTRASLLEPFDKDLIGFRHFPKSIVWNITSKCNLKCRHCISSYFTNANDTIITQNELEKLIDEMNHNGLERLQLSGGEPFLSNVFFPILNLIKNTNICVDIFTNGLNITPEYHKYFYNYLSDFPNSITFHISLDGYEKGHNYLRNNNSAYKNTYSNIKQITSYGGQVNIETIIHRKMMNNLSDFFEDLIELNIHNLYMHPIFYLDTKSTIVEPELTLDERVQFYQKFLLYKQKYDKYFKITYIDQYFPTIPYFFKKFFSFYHCFNSNVINPPINCIAGLEKMFINENGDVYPCLLYNNNKRDYCGNIHNITLKEAWKSSGMNKVREPIYKDDVKCRDCSYSRYCSGKVCSCRRAIEMLTNDYFGVMPVCSKHLLDK